MTGKISFSLRPATVHDLDFAEALYIGTMEPLLSVLGDWDEAEFRRRIRRSFIPEQSHIIICDNREIGVIQVIEAENDFNLAQIHLVEEFRDRGTGTALVRGLLDRAESVGKTVSLSAPRNNRAISLYKRLGFSIVEDDGGSIINMLYKAPSE